MRKTDMLRGYVALGDNVRGEGKSSERYLDVCRVTDGAGGTNQAPQKKQHFQEKQQAMKQRGIHIWSAVFSQDVSDAASNVVSFQSLPTAGLAV